MNCSHAFLLLQFRRSKVKKNTLLQTCNIEINAVNKYNKSSGRIYIAEKTDGRARKMKPKRLIALFMITFLLVGLFQGTGTIGAVASPAFTISKTSFIRGETAVFKCENADSSMHISIMNEGYKNYVYSPTGEKGDRRAKIFSREIMSLYCSGKGGINIRKLRFQLRLTPMRLIFP